MSLRKSSGNKVCIFPIGGIYVTSDSTNPKDIFGGTWKQLKDMFILACGDTYLNGSTGGEKNHTLTIDEMPSHQHPENIASNYSAKVPFTANYAGGSSVDGYSFSTNSGVIALKQTRVKTDDTGAGQPHNNMPPYIVKYVWERIS